ncbi:MAG: hypothetical protein LBC41_07005 [Clostridiales bacterium]|jgi:hypothetical protein|nr:hypothetical protein [Clostridiales bacterium]MDR2750389.1 hypothetical protein [Clostridiales bacterium]
MNCRYHPTKAGINTCSVCGQWLCEECSIDVNGRVYCKECLKKEYEAPRYVHAKPAAAKAPSSFLLFIFSFTIPGANYMYLGLIKRGLFIMSSFFLLGYLAAQLHNPLFGLAIPVLIITSAFDAFRIRKEIAGGKTVEDGVDDIIGTVARHKPAFVAGGIFLLAVSLLDWLGKFNYYHFGSKSIVCVIIAVLVTLFFTAKTGGGKKKKIDRGNDDLD